MHRIFQQTVKNIGWKSYFKGLIANAHGDEIARRDAGRAHDDDDVNRMVDGIVWRNELDPQKQRIHAREKVTDSSKKDCCGVHTMPKNHTALCAPWAWNSYRDLDLDQTFTFM